MAEEFKRFLFVDVDANKGIATCRIERVGSRRELVRIGPLYLGLDQTCRVLVMSFDPFAMTKGCLYVNGVPGDSFAMKSREQQEAAFRRYCKKKGLIYFREVYGPPPQKNEPPEPR